MTSVAVDGRGAVWIGAHGFVNDALARYADGRWETTEARAGLPKFQSAEVLGISATGDVWVSLRTAGSNYTARYDGTTWSVMPAPGVAAWSAVAPDEALWASAIGRYDWKNWVGLPAEVVLPLAPLVVAPDRTVFAIDADGRIVRLPALSPAP